jgi:hypothetical protein
MIPGAVSFQGGFAALFCLAGIAYSPHTTDEQDLAPQEAILIRKTVFITGAGASAPYDFPTGEELKKEVIETLTSNDVKTVDLFNESTFDHNKREEFAHRLRRSGRQSVDAFLEHNSDFVDIGKFAIARVLIAKEQLNTLFERNDWLRYLYQHLNSPFERFGGNEVAFITYNYDRSLETYLFECLRNGYGKGEDECAAQLALIPIVHLHGDLGALPWQEGATDARDYNTAIASSTVSLAARRIRIIHEDPKDRDDKFNQAKLLLKEAERIYFLGFGYDYKNMERLDIINWPRERRVYGTAPTLTQHERSEIAKRTAQRIEVTSHNCIDLLRNVVDWNLITK